MTLFKSPTYRNCQHELNLLKIGLLKVKEEKAKTKQSLKPSEYCSLLVKEADIESDIRLLERILK